MNAGLLTPEQAQTIKTFRDFLRSQTPFYREIILELLNDEVL